jgi:hypothetical protein
MATSSSLRIGQGTGHTSPGGGTSGSGTTGSGTTGSGTSGGGTSGSGTVPVGPGTAASTSSGSPASSSSSSDAVVLAGLCRADARGGLATRSAGYRKLVAAAGGADRIPAYCAALTSSAAPSGGASSHS